MSEDRAARRRARRAGATARVAGHRRRPRPALLASTALQATTVLLLTVPAMAQPAPGARPQGGAVVGGAASISQTATQTTVAQATQRAAIDWRSYDVGSGQTVRYLQPNPSAIVLNRVTGPDPSQIAGHIQANGQVVITNPSGVVFYQGSQVDAQTLIVSSAGITTQNFMAGKMAFDRPGHPDARITNAGDISIANTGLAALVAPQVANSGVIRAKMGHVVLAGAEAHTIDLYGDGLMSVDVTKAVRQAPGGGAALVTNTGTIMADGGTILLTAKAADGILQNLVNAGGTLQANTAGGHAGAIVVSAVGGTISIEGGIHTDGRAPGTAGGTVMLAATDTVAVQAGARITANGQAGGGTIALGTTPARARAQGGGVPDGAARAVTVAPGARIAADGRGTGSGGSIAILSTAHTAMGGSVSAQGGKQGGNGGNVEVSGRTGFALTGTIGTAAPHGTPGNILLDPDSVTIAHGAAGSATNDGNTGTGTVPATQDPASAYAISDGTINGFTGNVTVQATGNLTVNPGVTISLTSGLAQPTPASQNLVLQAGNALAVNSTAASPTSITASGNIVLTASTAGIAGATTNGNLSVAGTVTSTTGSVYLASNGTAPGASVFVNGAISAASPVGVVAIAGNIVGIGPAPSGPPATVTAGQRIDLSTGNTALTVGNNLVIDPSTTLSAPQTRIGQAAASADGLAAPDGPAATAITFAVPFTTLGTLELRTTGNVVQASGATVGAGTLTGSASLAITLAEPMNTIAALGTLATGASSAITTAGTLDVTGAVDVGSANTLKLTAAAIKETGGTINAGVLATTSTGVGLPANGGTTTLSGNNMFTNLGPVSAAGDATFNVGGALNLAGAVDVGANALTLNSVLGLAQSAGPVTAGTLTARVGDTDPTVTAGRNLTLNQAGNAIANLGEVSVKQGNLLLADGQSLTQLVNHTVTARNVTLFTADLVVNGALGACAIDPVTAGVVTLNATGHVTIAGIVGGENKTVVNGTTGATVLGAAAFLEAGNSPAGTALLQVNNGLTILGGVVAAPQINLGGGVNQSGGTLVATGPVANYLFTGGAVYSSSPLSISSSGLAANAVISGPSVTVNGTATNFTTAADVFASGNITFNLPGSFSQTAGRIGSGGTLLIAGGGALTPASGTIAQSGGGTLAGSTGVELYGAGAGTASLGGTIATPNLQAIEPAASLGFGPATLAGAFTQTAPAATVALHCPGCDGSLPSLSVVSGSLVPATTPAPAVRLDGNTLTLTSNFAAGTLELHSVGDTTQSAPFTAATLNGTAGYTATISAASLPTYSTPAGPGAVGLAGPNAITTLGPYYAGGNLSIASNTALSVVDKVVAGPNRTVSLQAPTLAVNGASAFGLVALGTVNNGAFSTALRPANAGTLALPATPATAATFGTVQLATDHLTLTGATSVVNAAGGVVAIAPSTPATSISIDPTAATTPWIVAPQLALVTTLGSAANVGFNGPQTLRLGSLDGSLGNGPSSLTLNAPLNLTNVAGTLGLYANGAVNETPAGGFTIGRAAAGPAPRIVGTLTGQASGAVTLTGGAGALTLANADAVTPTNHFDVLTGLSANGLSVADGAAAGAGLAGLTVQGTVSSGAGDLGLLSVGAVVGGVRQGGTIALGTATAAATLSAAGQMATLVARDGVSTAAAITETAASTVTAATLAGKASTAELTASAYDVMLDSSTSNAIATVGTFTVGTGPLSGLMSAQGAFRLRSTVPNALTVTGLVAAKSVLITANSMVVDGSIGACTVGGQGGTVQLTASRQNDILSIRGTVGGQASVGLNAGAGTSVLGTGLVDAPVVTVGGAGGGLGGLSVFGDATGTGQVLGTIVSVSGGVTVSSGRLRAGTLSPSTVTEYGSGDIYAGNDLTVALATQMIGGSIATPGNLTLVSSPLLGPANFGLTSTATLIAGGTLSISWNSDFTQSAGIIAAGSSVAVILPSSGQFNQATAALIESGSGTAGSGSITLQAAGSGNAGPIQGTLSAGQVQVSEPNAALQFTPSALLGPATVGVGPLTLTLHCPSCDANVAAAGYPLVATPGVGRPATLRVDGNTLVLGTVAADTIELHSVGDTTQAAGGILTAGTLLGTTGYQSTRTASALPTWNAPAATTGSLALTDANAVAKLGPFYAGGSLALTSTGSLAVTGLVAAGGGETATSPASTISLNAPKLTVDGAASSGSLQFGLVTGGAFTTNARPAASSPAPAPSLLAATDTVFNQVSLTTDQLQILGATPRVTALDGRVAIAPLTPGLAMSVDAVQAGPGSLVSSQLGLVSTIGSAGNVGNGGRQSLLLGSLDGTLANAAGSLTINAPLALTNAAATLGLYATGNIVENTATGIAIGRAAAGPNPQVVGTLTGQAGGEVRLVGQLADGTFGPLTLPNAPGATPANHFDVLARFAAGSGLAVADTPDAQSGQTGLALHGAIASGTGDLGLLSVGTVQAGVRVGGAIAIGDAAAAATLTTGTLTLVARDGAAGQPAITLNTAGGPASSITATTLQGRAQTADTGATTYDVSLLENPVTPNAFATLGTFTLGTGPATGVINPQGSLTLQTHGAPALLVAGTVAGKNATVNANTMTVTGAVGACTVPSAASGVVTLTADGTGPGAGAIAIAGGTVGGQSQVSLAAPQGVMVSAGTVTAPLVAIAANLMQSGGQVVGTTVAITGTTTITGGTLHATTLDTGTLGNGQPVPILYAAGDVYAGNNLAVTATGPILTGPLTAGGTLTVTAAGSLASTATLTAASQLTIGVGGDFQQTAGVIASRSVVAIIAGGAIGQSGGQSGGTIEAGTGLGTGAILLLGNGSPPAGQVAGLFGTLSANLIQAVEPGYAIQFGLASIAGGATVTAGTLGPLPQCSACAPVSGPPATASTQVLGAGRPADVRLDGATLTVGTVAADTIELHSAGDTTSTGALTATILTGSAGYAQSGVDPNGLPTYDIGGAQARIAQSAPGYTVAAPSAAGLATFGAANNVAAISTYQARLGLMLTDTPAVQTNAAGVLLQPSGLTLSGVVRAGPANDPLDATAAAASGGPVAIKTAGVNGQLTIAGTLAGSTVQLTTSGAIVETGGGAVVAGRLTGSAPAATFVTATSGASPQQGNQVATLDQFTATAGTLAFNDSRNLTATTVTAAGALTLSAQAGALTPAAPEGQAAGSLTFANLRAGSSATLTAAGTLSGTGVAAPTVLGLTAGQSVGANSIATGTVTGSAVQDFAAAGAFDRAGSIGAGAAVTLTDTSSLSLENAIGAGGVLTVVTGGTLATLGGSTQSGASITAAAAGTASIAGTLASPGTLLVQADGIAESAAGVIQGGAVTLDAGAGLLTQAGTVKAVTDLAANAGQGAAFAGTATAGGMLATHSGAATSVTGTLVAGTVLSLTARGLDIEGAVSAPDVRIDTGGATLSLGAPGTVTGGSVTSVSGSDTVLAGQVTAPGQASFRANGITITGSVVAGALTLDAGAGALAQDGAVQAQGTLTAAAGGSAIYAGVTSAGTFSGASAGPTSVSGTIAAAAIRLDAGASTLSSTGTLNAGGTVTLRTAGDIVLGAASTTGAGAAIVLVGEAEAPAGSARLGGLVSSPALTVMANVIALSGGTLNLGGVAQPSGVKAAALPTAAASLPGGYLEATSTLTQFGNTSVKPLTGFANATVRIDLTGGTGQVSLGNLYAPAANLILDVGAGSATGGTITVHNLFAIYTAVGPGSQGIKLTGTVSSQTGTAAAGTAAISPNINQNYEINGCAIASVNCVVLRPQALPIGNPLKELSLGFFREQEDDGELLVPNITEQGL